MALVTEKIIKFPFDVKNKYLLCNFVVKQSFKNFKKNQILFYYQYYLY